MSGRREAQVIADARLMGQASYIYEAGCGVSIDFERTLLVGDWAPEGEDDPSPAQRMLDEGIPDLLFERFGDQLEWHRPVAHRPPPLAPLPRQGRRRRGERAAGRARPRRPALPRQRRDQPADGVDRGARARLPPGPGRGVEGEGRRLPHAGARIRPGELHRRRRLDRGPRGRGSVGRFFCVANGPERDPALREALAAISQRHGHRGRDGRRLLRGRGLDAGRAAASRLARSRPQHCSSRLGPWPHDHATIAEEEYLQIMFWLEEAGLPITGANIARAMQLSPPTVHEMIGRLESDGYVSRSDDKSLDFTADGREQRRPDRPPPPADRALPHRRPWDPLGRGPRGGRAASSTRCRPCWRSACSPRSATRRPARTGTRSSRAFASTACCWLTSSPAPRSTCCASRTRPRRSFTTSRTPASTPASTASSSAQDDDEVVLTSDDGAHVVARDVAETVSVRADPAPPPRAPLPEQLVVSSDRYGR